jgi:uncharacterized RDD family membrane protein YckC
MPRASELPHVDGSATTAEAPVARVPYVGLVTRTIGFAIDAAIIELVALSITAVTALAIQILKLPTEFKTVAVAVGAVLWVLWTVGYFVFFWSTTGQTPGSRVMRIKVWAAGDPTPLLPRRALVRFGALVLAALPLFAGLFVILFDSRRRGFHDWVARTVVLEHEDAKSRSGPA